MGILGPKGPNLYILCLIGETIRNRMPRKEGSSNRSNLLKWRG
jgi:hypothetical protein